MAVLLMCTGCGRGRSPRQLYEKSGGFSYDPPSGWSVVEFPGLKYRISHGPRENDFAPNINVVDERFTGTLAEYIDVNLENTADVFVKMEVIGREDFSTEDGESGVRILIENEQQGRMLRQNFFFIGPGVRKYVVTCTALVDGGDRFDRVFSESVETFRIH